MDLPVQLPMCSNSRQKEQQGVLLLIATVMVTSCAVAVGALLFEQRASAKPAYMDRYNRDPYSRSEFVDKCIVCHVGRGGAERNDFGEAFEYAGYRITPKLRAKFPKLFEKEPRKEP